MGPRYLANGFSRITSMSIAEGGAAAKTFRLSSRPAESRRAITADARGHRRCAGSQQTRAVTAVARNQEAPQPRSTSEASVGRGGGASGKARA